jgi:CSLREA domain-containing protein
VPKSGATVHVPRRDPPALTGRLAIAIAVACSAALLLPGSAAAAAFMVNTTSDPVGASCPATCSLRAAIVAADHAGGSSTVTLPVGTFGLALAATGSSPADDPTTGDLDIDAGASVTINGAGPAASIVDANYIDRAFAVHQGAILTINGVTIEHGYSSGSGSGGNCTAAGAGGAVCNDGVLQLTHTALRGNYAQSSGGAIFADSGARSTSITNSVISNNAANTGGGLNVDRSR